MTEYNHPLERVSSPEDIKAASRKISAPDFCDYCGLEGCTYCADQEALEALGGHPSDQDWDWRGYE